MRFTSTNLLHAGVIDVQKIIDLVLRLSYTRGCAPRSSIFNFLIILLKSNPIFCTITIIHV